MRVLSAPSSLAWAGNRPRTSIAAPCQRMGHRLRRRTRRGQSASEVANACDGQFLKKTRTKGSEKTETPRISREKNQLRISSYSSANYSPIAGKSIYRISLERSGILLANQARVRAPSSNLAGLRNFGARENLEFWRTLTGVEGTRFSDLGQLFAARSSGGL